MPNQFREKAKAFSPHAMWNSLHQVYKHLRLTFDNYDNKFTFRSQAIRCCYIASLIRVNGCQCSLKVFFKIEVISCLKSPHSLSVQFLKHQKE